MFDRLSDSLSPHVLLDHTLLTENGSVSQKIRTTIAGLIDLGVSVHPSSRLYAYASMFEGPDNTSSVELDHALLESLQFAGILRAFQQMADPNPWLPLASEAIGGNISGKDDRPDSKARSSQWELFSMACLTMAGFAVCHGEPDLITRIAGQEVAFAAKRLRADGKLARNLRGGYEQLAKHQTPGFLSIDLSFINRLAKPVYVSRLDQQQMISAIVLDGYIQEFGKEFLAATRRPFVRGILAHTSIIGRSVEPPARFVSRRWILIAEEDSSINQELSAAIQNLGIVTRV